MESKLNDTLNASAMLHLALQKVDGIIASNGFYFFPFPCTCELTDFFFLSLHATNLNRQPIPMRNHSVLNPTLSYLTRTSTLIYSRLLI